jgi:hypothetical protein
MARGLPPEELCRTRRVPAELRVHPRRHWSTVLSGAVVLRPGERTILVQSGETAQFSTMAPQASGAHDRAAEILCILGHDGERALRAAHATAPGQPIHVTAMSGARSQLVNQAGRVGGTVRASTGDGVHRTRHDRSCPWPAEAR